MAPYNRLPPPADHRPAGASFLHRINIVTRPYITGFISALLLAGALVRADNAEQDPSELAKAVQNPVANLISVPLQNNINFDVGPENKTQSVLNIQPVIPVSFNHDWNIITRTILPVISQPGFTPEQDREFGLGDTVFTAFLSPARPGKIFWGAGPVLQVPTHTDDRLGTDRWGAGPSVVALVMPNPWVIGALINNVWDIGGSGDADIKLMTLQYFINYNFQGGWYLSSAPIITANWEADSDNTWTVPFGLSGGKVFQIGKQPMNAQMGAYYNVEKPEFGANWQLRLQLQFLFPKK
jgi:hypothetical protein